ncbi:hypothetical protein [Acidovorax sp. A1169]|uniref:ORC-CDC6 family AAA ATPase n=1 Tax=Acidovorax sp. A1169 TaxID=3059524 RepID=UPI002737CD00|nr:hypothetical protein [Acidovorax sp. A1169]MDP4073932.1 hypothetical protein [Acidovorax sp. A1169]
MQPGQVNPFALVRASDYTDDQINELWVELGPQLVEKVIEPTSGSSKYILGGKGTGKTHLLRYHSYQVARLRFASDSGLEVLKKLGYLAIFLRTTALDAARFEAMDGVRANWQMLFGVYIELRLAEGVLDAICDVKSTSSDQKFDDAGFIEKISQSLTSTAVSECRDVHDFRTWVIGQRKSFDAAINNAAFSGELNLTMPFAIGALCLPIKDAIGLFHPDLAKIPLLYLLDEIENLSEHQQQVINSLIRYGEGRATFRVTGRLYARKTLATMGGGEENRPSSEFSVTNLDPILKDHNEYPEFARNFIISRLQPKIGNKLNIRSLFCEITSSEFFEPALRSLRISDDAPSFISNFSRMLGIPTKGATKHPLYGVVKALTQRFPTILAKLNILIFAKRYKIGTNPIILSAEVAKEARAYLRHSKGGAYANAYGHYKGDLFAQICRESKQDGGVPYAGWDTFVDMSSGNPRNLLVVLGGAYSIAAFRELMFAPENPLPVDLQTAAAEEAAKFMFEQDTNYGSDSDLAKIAIARLGVLLRTARYSLNIPEVSPLAVSFSNEGLTPQASQVLQYSLNYSLVFEIQEGRPDRNSDQLRRKIFLNPMLSPRWGLGTGRRGDISLNDELVNSIFDQSRKAEFDSHLKSLSLKWNDPFSTSSNEQNQTKLFE